jgi:RNA recognition motif-containing protein
MKIFVANLNFNTTSDGLYSAFEAFGEVSSAAVVTDHETGHSKGFGFVEMPNDDEAMAAIEGLNNSDFGGKPITLTEAHELESRDHHDENRGGGSNHGGGGSRNDGRW